MNRKRKFFALFAFMLCAVCSNVNADNTLSLGNCRNAVASYMPVSGTETAGAALFYPASTMKAYKGCQLTEFHIALTNSTKNDAVTLFLSHGIDQEPFFSFTTDAPRSGWNTFTLPEPCTLDGQDICIGYTVKGNKYINGSSPLVTNEEWLWLDADGWKRSNGQYSASFFVNITGESLPLHNVRIGNIQIPSYSQTGVQTAVGGYFQNLGAETVNKLTFSYIVDGKETATETVTGLSVSPRSEGSFSLKGFSFDKEGEYKVALSITGVNDGEDAVPDDNTTPESKMLCREHFTKRNTLMEIFSTEQCAQCPAAHVAISKLLKDVDDVVEIGHHAGFYTDGYTLDESLAYEWFYDETFKFAPAIMFDRLDYVNAYPKVFVYHGPVVDANTTNVNLLHTLRSAVPAQATVDIKPSMEGRKLSVHVEGRQLLPVDTPDSTRLYVYLTEDSIYSTQQVGAQGGFWHRHVARKSLTTTWGDKINMSEGYKADYTLDIPEDWNIGNMRVVAFVANYNAKDKSDCMVYNSTAVRLRDFATGISLPVVADEEKLSRWTVSRLSGETVAKGDNSAYLINTVEGLPHGIYIVNNGRNIKKIVK